jgi:hypothetical protein
VKVEYAVFIVGLLPKERQNENAGLRNYKGAIKSNNEVRKFYMEAFSQLRLIHLETLEYCARS